MRCRATIPCKLNRQPAILKPSIMEIEAVTLPLIGNQCLIKLGTRFDYQTGSVNLPSTVINFLCTKNDLFFLLLKIDGTSLPESLPLLNSPSMSPEAVAMDPASPVSPPLPPSLVVLANGHLPARLKAVKRKKQHRGNRTTSYVVRTHSGESAVSPPVSSSCDSSAASNQPPSQQPESSFSQDPPPISTKATIDELIRAHHEWCIHPNDSPHSDPVYVVPLPSDSPSERPDTSVGSPQQQQQQQSSDAPCRSDQSSSPKFDITDFGKDELILWRDENAGRCFFGSLRAVDPESEGRVEVQAWGSNSKQPLASRRMQPAWCPLRGRPKLLYGAQKPSGCGPELCFLVPEEVVERNIVFFTEGTLPSHLCDTYQSVLFASPETVFPTDRLFFDSLAFSAAAAAIFLPLSHPTLVAVQLACEIVAKGSYQMKITKPKNGTLRWAGVDFNVSRNFMHIHQTEYLLFCPRSSSRFIPPPPIVSRAPV
uniref:Uncharacterized protein n=1 Tax=Chromera velia CCMP2878 TaxID=1169474 RepID=A0A0G4GNE4_9ALVE|eukprot:Cvel_22653.t1-p1 / transcript=Cvel_22653.t1 / gene=Cvel_22653 / organism=Chromera_velia_CCMP2878 / gene_product=hypothetical protein / transcript_product=hypothetical protein / location=Cvel_scaffold2250:9983-13059(-) / protein_length=481 / sequence_SO=supercontig / SO=protein_coding / is_pseudo=false